MSDLRRGFIKKIGSTLWMHFEGRTFTVDMNTSSSARRSKQTHGVTDGFLRSPMPGKVLKLNFKPGQSVKSGETVCVLEAMKMEYALKASFDGKIKNIFKNAGEQVLLDDKIVELEK
ncbi:MAG: acetyl-CoA carboxylase biotin carboxyl carrier protein subunit [Oligoflexia bacterium]|nr:acetyl-CoA carboxylase biotin carboxyl carrier protein subunit [Oligoflexia bacterium]